jgi:hypothetical protein
MPTDDERRVVRKTRSEVVGILPTPQHIEGDRPASQGSLQTSERRDACPLAWVQEAGTLVASRAWIDGGAAQGAHRQFDTPTALGHVSESTGSVNSWRAAGEKRREPRAVVSPYSRILTQ